MDAFIGTIMPWPVNYAPAGWALCDGSLLLIQQRAALYAVIGTRYGGNGTVNFALPNLIGKMPIGTTDPTLLGKESGSASTTFTTKVVLDANQLPPHTHTATATVSGLTGTTTIEAQAGDSGGLQLASEQGILTGTTSGTPLAAAIYLPSGTAQTTPVTLGGVTSTVSGATMTVAPQTTATTPPAPISFTTTIDTVPPFVTVNYIICVDGLFPNFN